MFVDTKFNYDFTVVIYSWKNLQLLQNLRIVVIWYLVECKTRWFSTDLMCIQLICILSALDSESVECFADYAEQNVQHVNQIR